MTRPAEPVGLRAVVVVAEALRLIDRHGLEGFSIRNLARELGVNPTAVTWHVGNRNQLLAAVADLVLRGVDGPADDEPWEVRLRHVASRFRATMFEHPNVAPLVGTQLTPNAGSQVVAVELLLRALADAGVADERLVDVMNAVLGAVVGFVVVELARPPDDPAGEWADEVRDRAARLHPLELPLITAHRDELVGRSFVFRWESGSTSPLDGAFVALLDVLVAGVRATATAPD